MDIHPFGAMFTYEHRPGTSELKAARFYGALLANESGWEAVARTIISVVKQAAGINKTDLMAAVKKQHASVGVNRIRVVIEDLEKAGKISATAGPQTTICFYPNEDRR